MEEGKVGKERRLEREGERGGGGRELTEVVNNNLKVSKGLIYSKLQLLQQKPNSKNTDHISTANPIYLTSRIPNPMNIHSNLYSQNIDFNNKHSTTHKHPQHQQQLQQQPQKPRTNTKPHHQQHPQQQHTTETTSQNAKLDRSATFEWSNWGGSRAAPWPPTMGLVWLHHPPQTQQTQQHKTTRPTSISKRAHRDSTGMNWEV